MPLWRATDACCRMKARDCASLVAALTRLPMSAKKSRALLPMAPAVSTTTATKWCVRAKSRYFAFFLSSANAATAPASLVAWARCDAAKVSVHVASQTRVRPYSYYFTLLTGAVNTSFQCMYMYRLLICRVFIFIHSYPLIITRQHGT